MARVIELIGAPGVGKTATYDALCSRQKRGAWLPYSNLRTSDLLSVLPEAEQYDGDKSFRSAKKQLVRRLFPNVYQRQLKVFLIDALSRKFVAKNPQLPECMWQVALHRSLDSRFSFVRGMMRTFGEFQLIRELRGLDHVLRDEGVAHALDRLELLEHAQLDECLAPLRDSWAVVHVDAAPEVVFDRLMSRKKTIKGHRGLSEQDLWNRCVNAVANKRRIAQTLGERGVAVVSVDAKNLASQVAALEERIPAL